MIQAPEESEPASPDFDARFREIRARFLKRSQTDRPKMEKLFVRLESAPEFEEELRELSLLVHRYAGGGRTFGFHEVSETAAKLEMSLKKMKDRESFLSLMAETKLQLQDLLRSLDNAVALHEPL